MLKLIKLEHRRNNFKNYIYGAIGICIFTTLIGILLNATPRLEPNDETVKVFATIDGLVPMITVISLNGFIILSSIMYAKFVVEEYTGKKNVLLFTYPQKRSEILLAKFIIIFGFTFICMKISNIITITIVILIGNATGLLSESITTDSITNIVYTTLIFSIVANLVSILALRIGFSKKSIIWTIVAAIVLSSPFGNIVMLLQNNLLTVTLISTIFLLIGCSILFLGLLKKVNRMECL